MGLKDYPKEALVAELKRREEEEIRPLHVVNTNFNNLYRYVTESVNNVVLEGGSLPKDFEHWIFEEVMDVIYGPEGAKRVYDRIFK